MNQGTDETQYQGSDKGLMAMLESSGTNVDKASQLEYNVDGCSCMSCGCHKTAWSLVLSPAGIAAGMLAYAAAAALELGGK